MGWRVMSQVKMTREVANNILREVAEDSAFHFYKSIDAPTGITARSLQEFHDALRGVEPSSVEFHIVRGDFVNWVKMLGDLTLAKQIESLKGKGLPADEARKLLILLVRLRMGRLRKTAAS